MILWSSSLKQSRPNWPRWWVANFFTIEWLLIITVQFLSVGPRDSVPPTSKDMMSPPCSRTVSSDSCVVDAAKVCYSANVDALYRTFPRNSLLSSMTPPVLLSPPTMLTPTPRLLSSSEPAVTLPTWRPPAASLRLTTSDCPRNREWLSTWVIQRLFCVWVQSRGADQESDLGSVNGERSTLSITNTFVSFFSQYPATANSIQARTKYDIIIDESSNKPGEQVSYLLMIGFLSDWPILQSFEKMIAGLYLGEIFRLVLCELIDSGDLFLGQNTYKLEKAYAFDTAFLSLMEA